jgi:sterol desaturase/sphingolipid hydroxylase (fatty acid hydroxylase superfamily)
MEEILEKLNNLTPVFLIGGLSFFMVLEAWRPYFERSAGRRKQRWRNVVMIAIGAAASFATSGLVVVSVAWSEANSFGALYRFFGHSALSIAIGIPLIDLCLYTTHVTMHKVPALWRVHRVHHADTELDASSGLRAHPIELMLLQVMMALALPLLGIPQASNVLYTTLALPWFALNHSNLKFPIWFERVGSLVMSTPDWHRVHHSSYQIETDSHYGCVFSVWDRLFGTARKARVPTIRFGLETFREPSDQTVGALLKLPFRP